MCKVLYDGTCPRVLNPPGCLPASGPGAPTQVKRARSYYIRKEEEARLRQQTVERQREDQGKMFAEEQSRRLREAEEASYARSMAESKGLAHHLQSFDARAHRQQIAQEMQMEMLGRVPGDGPPSAQASSVGRVRKRAARRGHTTKISHPSEQEAGNGQVLVGAEAEAEMRRRVMEHRRKRSPQLSLDNIMAPGSDGRTLSAKDEERIRKQAMIEIMKEGDKLSKTASKNLRPEDINIAHLIRERVEQIR